MEDLLCRIMGHGKEHDPVKLDIPDYRIWKVEGTQLEQVQKKLAKKGLKDPWARNEVWRFMGEFGTPQSVYGVIFRGFKWGAAAFVLSLMVEYSLQPPRKDQNAGNH